MISTRSVLSGMLALALLAPAAHAQSAEASSSSAAPVQEHAEQSQEARPAAGGGPTIDAATAGIRPATTPATVLPGSAQQQGSFGRAETLMIVGGAAFVAGLIIGDDAGTIVMVSGAAIGLYGLYLYLQTH